jgi:hypothetical protein
MATKGAAVVMSGNPVDGVTLYGPFATVDDANEWADHQHKFLSEWWIVTLRNPEEFNGNG